MITHDIIVIGGGLAGMRAAIGASKESDIAIITRTHPVRSHSGAAQGGINAVIDERDSIESHWFDTVKGSDYLCDQDAAEILVREAPFNIYQIEHWGTIFSRTVNGRIAQRPFGGQSFPRTCYGADKTGHLILQTLNEQLMKHDIKIYHEWTVTKIVVIDGIVRGVVAYEQASGEFIGVRAKSVIVTTGGAGRMYKVTSNAHVCTGDGMALALKAGAALKDMECLQFHPTGLYRQGILVSEGCRGEGGYLLSDDKLDLNSPISIQANRFMKKYAPEKMELGPRDLVSRSIWTEIIEGRGINGRDFVYLDLRHIGEKKIMERLPQVRELCLNYVGVDPIKDPIPVQPTAHFTMGGISTDVNGISPEIEGMFAAGECACVSCHGANRLGGNSLLETIVFGKRSGENASKYAKTHSLKAFPTVEFKDELDRINRLLENDGNESVSGIRTELQEAMTIGVGIFRDEEIMKRAIDKIRELKERYNNINIQDKGRVYNTDLIGALELENLLILAEIVAVGAYSRKESRGAHYRNDYPHRDDNKWLKHTLAKFTPEGLRFEYKKVNITKFQPQERKY
ncbi:MAG: FAD-binding protein [Candidatus Thermoplasmatota archaeon]|nr:FAD-binding protein [Candidatus Thermoplasmatota archaeon]MDP7265112.1 FAD-binding protein [Candidatus Thermoplasmatota archaeon]